MRGLGAEISDFGWINEGMACWSRADRLQLNSVLGGSRKRMHVQQLSHSASILPPRSQDRS